MNKGVANMELTTIGWVLVSIGFLPWRIGWRTQRKSVYTVTIQAAFWRLRVEQGNQGRHWQLTLPLLVRLKGAIWSALQTLIKG
jgi:hypothetical protein